VIKNFLGGSAADPDGTLLQLVLAGRPELKAKLSEAALFPLRRRTPVVCELEPLNSQEIGSYIGHGLRSNDHAGELFDARAIKRIALYTKGNPRSINALCERASQLADESGTTVVSAELIDVVARDLGFHESAFVAENINNIEKNFQKPDPIEPSARRFHSPEDYMEVVVGRTFLDYNTADEPQGLYRTAKRRTAWVSMMLFLIAISATGAWMSAERARDSLAYWSAMLNGMTARLQPRASVNGSETASEPITAAGPIEPLPTPAVVAPPSEPYPIGTAPEAAPETLLAPLTGYNSTESSLTRDAKSQPQVPSLSNEERRAPLEVNSNQFNRVLQAQIIKAIENRAIFGVEVSVVRGTAFLDGRVATERQRRAAERAAHSVDKVSRVRNRIVVD
jgi:hypothetical protein